MAAVKTFGCTTPLDGPLPPDYMNANNSLAYAVRANWLRDNNEHLYHHEEVRLAQGAVSRARSPKVPGYRLPDAETRLRIATEAYRKYHHAHGYTHEA